MRFVRPVGRSCACSPNAAEGLAGRSGPAGMAGIEAMRGVATLAVVANHLGDAFALPLKTSVKHWFDPGMFGWVCPGGGALNPRGSASVGLVRGSGDDPCGRRLSVVVRAADRSPPDRFVTA
jgi:hypothetical protein